MAGFTDTDTVSAASDFSATIQWGDGAVTGGTVTGSASTFAVSGSHTYTAPGGDAVIAVAIHDIGGTAAATANSSATVAGGALAAQVVLTSATEHVALPGTTAVATFLHRTPDTTDTAMTASPPPSPGATAPSRPVQ